MIKIKQLLNQNGFSCLLEGNKWKNFSKSEYYQYLKDDLIEYAGNQYKIDDRTHHYAHQYCVDYCIDHNGW
jgi:hypothetical protein